jgi:hypothetical protein
MNRRGFLKRMGLAAVAAPMAALALPEVVEAATSTPHVTGYGTVRINSVAPVAIRSYSRGEVIPSLWSSALMERLDAVHVYGMSVSAMPRPRTHGTPSTLRDWMRAHA